MFIGGFELTPQFTSWYSSIFSKLDSIFAPINDFINPAFNYIIQMFNYLSKIIIWLSSYSGLKVEFIYVIIGLISSGIGIIVGSFVIKLVVKWWSVLVP